MLGATAACHFSTIFRHLHFKKWPETVSFLAFWLENALLATAARNFSTSQLQKVVRTWQFFSILTWKCASRYSGVQFFHIATSKSGPNMTFFSILTWKCASRYSGVRFFNIATSKSGPNMQCFVHFDFKMCFSVQRRAIFQHRNFKKWSEHAVFCTFWLQNVLLATAACNFSCLLWIATSAPAALPRLLFDPADTQIIEKHSISRLP